MPRFTSYGSHLQQSGLTELRFPSPVPESARAASFSHCVILQSAFPQTVARLSI